MTLQRDKTEIFAWGELPPNTPPELKRAGVMVNGTFEPGFDCYGIPMGTDAFVHQALQIKAAEVKRDMEQVSKILANDSQALWVLRQLLKLLLAELRWLLEEEKQIKAGGDPYWSQGQELAQNMVHVGPSCRGRANRSPPSSARSWTAPWQLVKQWRRRQEVGPVADKH